MSNAFIMLTENIKSSIRDALNNAMINGIIAATDIPDINVEIPANRNNGDLSSNIAMTSAKIFKISPHKIAEIIVSDLKSLSNSINKVEIAGAGFINFYLNQDFYGIVLKEINEREEYFGRSNIGKGKKVMVEFVSANPTGPMHMGNARIGAFGDCLSSILDAVGYNVHREFYVNDAGNQIEKFATSLDIRYQQIYKGENSIELPETCYQGEDIKHLAKEFSDKYSDEFINKDENERKQALISFALPKNIEKMQKDMFKYKINFDKWFNESELYKNGEVKNIIDTLTKNGYTYEKEGALWYKASLFGAEKDEVLVRKNGIPTYFAADIAYHINKIKTRNFDLCIDVLGADHHGHVSRIKSAITEALGVDKKKLHILLIQLVRLIKDGEVIKMSKRTGKAIQLSNLIDEVSSDAARFIFNMYEAGSSMDFDLDIAVRQDSKNPVYYVQYAYARICSIIKSLDKEMIENIKEKRVNFSLLESKEEKELIFHMSILTDEIIRSAKSFDPTRITRYVITLANLFHKFYTEHKVLTDEPDIMYARIHLCICTKIVIKNILNMLKITTPENM